MATSYVSGEIDGSGRFQRQKTAFVTPFGDQEGQLPIEKDRYRLIVSYACPWAHRQLIALKLLGLENVVSIGVVDPVRPTDVGRTDWAFSLDPEGCDPILGSRYLSDLYLRTDPQYQGRFTVPAVLDLETGQVVNNDFYNLLKIWEKDWEALHKADAPDLYPEALRDSIDQLNDWLFHTINNGVYKAGFATSQEAYEEAYDALFAGLDQLEERLAHSRYLFGDQVTDSDIRLYVSLVRFDAAYYNGFRCNRNRLIDFPNLWAYARDLYQQPAFGQTTNFDHIKKHYHLSAIDNPHQIVPKGPDETEWLLPHDRDKRDYTKH